MTVQEFPVHMNWTPEKEAEEISAFSRWYADEIVDFIVAKKYTGVTAYCGHRVAGFLLYEVREASLKLHELAVAPWCRRRGVGRQIARHLFGSLPVHGRDKIVAAVAEDDLAAQLFFRAAGFRAEKILRRRQGDLYFFIYRAA